MFIPTLLLIVVSVRWNLKCSPCQITTASNCLAQFLSRRWHGLSNRTYTHNESCWEFFSKGLKLVMISGGYIVKYDVTSPVWTPGVSIRYHSCLRSMSSSNHDNGNRHTLGACSLQLHFLSYHQLLVLEGKLAHQLLSIQFGGDSCGGLCSMGSYPPSHSVPTIRELLVECLMSSSPISPTVSVVTLK